MGNMNNTLKDRLNMKNLCYVMKNKVDGEILSYLPDVPFWGRLCDYVFIMTLPAQNEKCAPTYCRLQDKTKQYQQSAASDVKTEVTVDDFLAWKKFDQVKEFGRVVKNKRSRNQDNDDAEEILVCAPRSQEFVDFSQIVLIANIPDQSKDNTTVYIKKKRYDKNKSELTEVIHSSAAPAPATAGE